MKHNALVYDLNLFAGFYEIIDDDTMENNLQKIKTKLAKNEVKA